MLCECEYAAWAGGCGKMGPPLNLADGKKRKPLNLADGKKRKPLNLVDHRPQLKACIASQAGEAACNVFRLLIRTSSELQVNPAKRELQNELIQLSYRRFSVQRWNIKFVVVHLGYVCRPKNVGFAYVIIRL